MKLHLVDGTYEIFRAFYGAPSACAPDGLEVAASRAWLRSLWSMLRQPDVTHIAVAFDTVIASFRNRLFAGYKTGEGIDPSLWAQFPLAEQAAHALGVVVWPMVEFEADDAIATAAARFGADVEQVVICSPDKDFGQCVRGRQVVLHDRLRDKILDEDAIGTKFGVPPASIPDWLALVGDVADGIPGIPKWGAKSAATLLRVYEHINAIPDDVDTWKVKPRGAHALAASLRARRRDAELYRVLATLRTDVPLSETLDALAWHGARREALNALCIRLGMSRFLEKVDCFRDLG